MKKKDLNTNSQPETVMIFCPNWVGDVVMATPVFSCLRKNYPHSKLIGVIRKYAGGVIEDSPWFDSIIACDDKSISGMMDLIKTVRKIDPDMTILFSNSFRSALIIWLGGSKKIFGYHRNLRSFLLNGGPKPFRKNRKIQPVPMVEYYMALCRFLKLQTETNTRPSLYLSDQLEKRANSLLDRYGIKPDDMVIGLNPGAKFGSSKCWPPEYFARLAELLEQNWECKILLFAGPGEDGIAQTISEESKANIINTAPDKIDLTLLKPMIKRCRLLITNDTGTRHYAVAFDVPVVVIMGSTNPEYTAKNLEKSLLIRKELECSPCHKKQCPHDHHNCMKMIRPEDVLQGSIDLLESLKNK